MTPQPAGYSGTPLPQKLGIKPASHIVLDQLPASFAGGWPKAYGTLPEAVLLTEKLPRGRLAAVLLPSPLAFNSALWRSTLAAQALDPNGYDSTRPTRWLRDLFDREGIPALDLTAALSAASERGERIYYPIDRHLNPAGYDLVALEVARFVAERFPIFASR